MNNAPKYPVLLVHGMGFRDRKHLNYWGRIPRALESMGCRIFYGNQDSSASVETNAAVIAERIREIVEETGAEKINIIAHSKGGLESRRAISSLGMAERVASLTTLSTPHNGSKTMDKIMKLPRGLLKFGCVLADGWFKLLGDKNPDCYRAIAAFTTDAAAEFNRANPDADGIYYQSYAFVMKHPFSDIFMWFPGFIVGLVEGENDGLLAPEAVKHGSFKGIFRGVGARGISHCDEVDMRRRPLSKKAGEGVSDIVNIYKDIVKELSEIGL